MDRVCCAPPASVRPTAKTPRNPPPTIRRKEGTARDYTHVAHVRLKADTTGLGWSRRRNHALHSTDPGGVSPLLYRTSSPRPGVGALRQPGRWLRLELSRQTEGRDDHLYI